MRKKGNAVFTFFRPSAALLLRKKLPRFFLVSARIHCNVTTFKSKTRARTLYLIISSSCLKIPDLALYQKQHFCKMNGIKATLLYDRLGVSKGILTTAQSWRPITVSYVRFGRGRASQQRSIRLILARILSLCRTVCRSPRCFKTGAGFLVCKWDAG